MAKKSVNKYRIKAGATAQGYDGKLRIGVDNYKKDADYEPRKFTIGYEYYNQSLCEITYLDKSPLRKILENCKKFSKCSSVRELASTGVTLNPISNSNHYQKFFSGLAPDIELKEFDSGEKARAFFYIDPVKNIIQMVAYTNTHVENKKQKK